MRKRLCRSTCGCLSGLVQVRACGMPEEAAQTNQRTNERTNQTNIKSKKQATIEPKSTHNCLPMSCLIHMLTETDGWINKFTYQCPQKACCSSSAHRFGPTFKNCLRHLEILEYLRICINLSLAKNRQKVLPSSQVVCRVSCRIPQ